MPKADYKIVNHRRQLISLEEVVDHMLPEWPAGEHPDFSGPQGHSQLKSAFMQLGSYLLSRLSLELEKAAGKGISEALNLIQDPDYYETVKRRRARDRERQKQWRSKSDKQAIAARKDHERRERGELTEIERLHEMAHVAIQIQYHEKQLSKLSERRDLLDRCIPIKERPQIDIEDADDDRGDDFWPDRISFD